MVAVGIAKPYCVICLARGLGRALRVTVKLCAEGNAESHALVGVALKLRVILVAKVRPETASDYGMVPGRFHALPVYSAVMVTYVNYFLHSAHHPNQ